MDLAGVWKDQSGPLALVAIVIFAFVEIMGLIPKNNHITQELVRLSTESNSLEQRVNLSEQAIIRLALSVENNREYMTNTSSTLQRINESLNDIRLSITKMEAFQGEMDRRMQSGQMRYRGGNEQP